MNLSLLSNPEWVRHRRALLRPATATAIVAVTLMLCALTASIMNEHVMVGMVLLAHLVGLPIWVGFTCSKSITHERALETFDFWRTTRLTPYELILGQLCGVPLMGFLTAACTMPIAIMAVTLGINPVDFVLGYVMLLLLCATIGLGGLVSSMWATPFRSGRGLLWFIVGYFLLWMLSVGSGSFWKHGLSTMTPYHYLGEIGMHLGEIDVNILAARTDLFFGRLTVPSVLLGVGLNVSLSWWFLVMLQRNIKKNLDDIRFLSRWQAVGFAMFLNLLFYALWKPSPEQWRIGAISTVAQGLYVLNLTTLYVIGMMVLTPHERLRVWWREWSAGRASYLAEDGLPWPWVVMTVVCMAAPAYLAMEFSHGNAKDFAWQLGILAVFVIRDITFLQWCLCQNFKRPLFTGLLYLSLYYFIAQFFLGQSLLVGNLFVPSFLIDSEPSHPLVTILVQGLITWLILWQLLQQLKTPARILAPTRVPVDERPLPTA